jgi:phage/plasmid-associated DNA primase
MNENIIKLADLQDAGELPATSEDALALAYADRHAEDSRYVAAWGRWLLFDGARWHFDTTLHAFSRARVICREVALECDKPAGVTARPACPCRSPPCRHGRAMGREPSAARHDGGRR